MVSEALPPLTLVEITQLMAGEGSILLPGGCWASPTPRVTDICEGDPCLMLQNLQLQLGLTSWFHVSSLQQNNGLPLAF